MKKIDKMKKYDKNIKKDLILIRGGIIPHK